MVSVGINAYFMGFIFCLNLDKEGNMKCNANMVYEMFWAKNCYERSSFEQLGKMFDLAECCFVEPEFLWCYEADSSELI